MVLDELIDVCDMFGFEADYDTETFYINSINDITMSVFTTENFDSKNHDATPVIQEILSADLDYDYLIDEILNSDSANSGLDMEEADRIATEVKQNFDSLCSYLENKGWFFKFINLQICKFINFLALQKKKNDIILSNFNSRREYEI